MVMHAEKDAILHALYSTWLYCFVLRNFLSPVVGTYGYPKLLYRPTQVALAVKIL